MESSSGLNWMQSKLALLGGLLDFNTLIWYNANVKEDESTCNKDKVVHGYMCFVINKITRWTYDSNNRL